MSWAEWLGLEPEAFEEAWDSIAPGGAEGDPSIEATTTPGLGMASLVGAGPGDPGLITDKGLKRLGTADVVLYDHLVSEALVAAAPPGAERICVGKRAGRHTLPQREIANLMCQRVRAGQRVVRLKGGDPFVFGRGGEEAEALAEAELPFEVIPGVTAGIAAPAYAGIPVTYRESSRGVILVTGHADPRTDRDAVDWASLAASGLTICVYMGVRNTEAICSALRAGGRPASEPAAIVEMGCTPCQRTVSGTLETLPARARGTVQAPALLIVGDVVRLGANLTQRRRQRLFGQTLLIVGPTGTTRRLSTWIEGEGGRGLGWRPVVMRYHRPGGERLLSALTEDSRPKRLIFEDRRSVAGLRRALEDAGKDARLLQGLEIIAVGRSAAQALAEYGLRADRQLRHRSELSTELHPVHCEDQTAIHVLAEAGPSASTFDPLDPGATALELPLYTRASPRRLPQAYRKALREGHIDAIALTSPRAAERFCRALDKNTLRKLNCKPWRPRVHSAGPRTTAVLEDFGLAVDVEARTGGDRGLFQAILRRPLPRRGGSTRPVAQPERSPAKTLVTPFFSGH